MKQIIFINNHPHLEGCACTIKSHGQYVSGECTCEIPKEIALMEIIKRDFSYYKKLNCVIADLQKEAQIKQCEANALYSNIEGLKKDLIKLLEK